MAVLLVLLAVRPILDVSAVLPERVAERRPEPLELTVSLINGFAGNRGNRPFRDNYGEAGIRQTPKWPL